MPSSSSNSVNPHLSHLVPVITTGFPPPTVREYSTICPAWHLSQINQALFSGEGIKAPLSLSSSETRWEGKRIDWEGGNRQLTGCITRELRLL